MAETLRSMRIGVERISISFVFVMPSTVTLMIPVPALVPVMVNVCHTASCSVVSASIKTSLTVVSPIISMCPSPDIEMSVDPFSAPVL